ncbi:MAG: XTP/dITP diphosphatase [Patescibacteria group bacterium]
MKPVLITGNQGKLREFQAFIPELDSITLDLPEYQEIDPKHILKLKLESALKQAQRPVIVDDVSFYMDCIPGLPGPFIKWFNQTIGPKGLYEMADKYGNYQAEAKCLIGYADLDGKIMFFEGLVKGILVPSRGAEGFGFDSVFQPDGHSQTYAELDVATKNSISHRGLALRQLKQFLDRQKMGD